MSDQSKISETAKLSGEQSFRKEWDGITVECFPTGEDVQPWTGQPCFRYRVEVETAKIDFSQSAYGSQVDFENGDNEHCEEMAWLVLRDILSAYSDPDEFWGLAASEPDMGYEHARGILAFIDSAAQLGPILERYAEEIDAKYEES